MGLNVQFSDSLRGSFTYLVDTSLISNPREKSGLFDGQFGALAQLTFSPSDRFGLAFTYVRYTNFLLMRYTSTPQPPELNGGARKASVASIYEIGITTPLNRLEELISQAIPVVAFLKPPLATTRRVPGMPMAYKHNTDLPLALGLGVGSVLQRLKLKAMEPLPTPEMRQRFGTML